MSKIANLQNALNSSTGKTIPAPMKQAEKPDETAQISKTPNRANQVNMSAWLHRDFKKRIRLLQAKLPEDKTLQDLMAEAFNDLFSKYNVPTVNQD